MFEKLLKNWFEIKNISALNISHILGSPIEYSDERGVYYIEEIFFDDNDHLCGWCMDVDGEEFDISGLFLSNDDELKIINWMTNNA